MSEVEDTIKRICNHKGVTGCMVFNNQGIIIRTSLEQRLTIHYAALVTQLVHNAKSTVKKLDETDDLTFIRLRTGKNEILIAPDRDYILVVIQNPTF
ncbi:dynein light chain, roadblock-type [Monocercomonoides exilis]|uniref:dynein light chain, roadblock-type n=1 Tax=Monocercomonoides exilis TaxID=2049356 RepID=UPI00355AB40E|nr:dynein light chain, roadblock-type [Monocercomonoides exilis]|eukprot:MONOS_1315.1-p1 / transcript=MONOS_1315.1 / gene=MONOS_1315 / organism=Monocercomonoides_exilis_PA203 / gene_product=dynein light chain, roadblock-type / transcript_product=dynein light chain, roadblock-type / location=Mono_scaffold00022:172781-173303(+) / protein_length=96 / sequence_SO=supercontig / SO=protein_coding / is_pseudo=false